MNLESNRLRLCRLMCGRSLTFRDGHLNSFGAKPQMWGAAPRDFMVGIPVRHSLTAHQAAKPRSQPR
jgi:hypothetical protein